MTIFFRPLLLSLLCLTTTVSFSQTLGLGVVRDARFHEAAASYVEDHYKAAPDYVFVWGGINDGAAVGQQTRLAVTPDDHLRCAIVSDLSFLAPIDQQGVSESTHIQVMVRDEPVPGLYEALTTAMDRPMTAGEIPDTLHKGNFLVEVGQGGKKQWLLLSFEDAGFDALLDVFGSFEHPCWAFG